MTAVSLVVTPVLLVFAVLFFRKVRCCSNWSIHREGRLTTLLQENLTGIRVVRAFGQQQFEISRFHERNGELRDLEYRLFIALSNYWRLLRRVGLTAAGTGAGRRRLFRSARRDFDRHLGLLLLAGTDDHLADTPNRPRAGRFGEASVAIDRIQAILGEPVESVEPVPDWPIGGDIEIRELTFRYHEDHPPSTDCR